MGHLIENDIIKRSDFNDEGFLFQMALLLERHPLNRDLKKSKETIISASNSSRYYISIENKELDDPLSVVINCPHGSANIIVGKTGNELPTEIDVSRYFD